MQSGQRFYRTLFFSMLQLSAFTFGGGYVIVPLMRKRFVNELDWIQEQEMLDMIAIAQSTPGAMAVNTSILVGYKLGGIRGALVSTAGTVLPPLIVITIISAIYAQIRDNAIIAQVLGGMQAGVAAVIAAVVIDMVRAILKQKRFLTIAIMLAAFLASTLTRVNVVLIILICGAIGAIDDILRRKKQRKENERAS